MIAVTGATGQLGRLVVKTLLEKTDAAEIVAVVRNPEAAKDLADLGVVVRQGDYDAPETLVAAFDGVSKVLLISSNAVRARVAQHKAVIDAAKSAGVSLLAYTSILDALKTPLGLAEEHVTTEPLLQASGLPVTLLRNGWYNENYTMALPTILEHNAVVGCAGEGRFSTASRQDYAKAAAVVLTSDTDQAGKIYELAGDTSFSLSELAQEYARQTGREIAFQNIPEADYAGILAETGMPEGFAKLLADSETGAAQGWLQNEGKALSALIGRPTTPISYTIAEALRA